MVIQHNMQAMNTNRQLGISVGAAAKSTEKLSSGYRINRAGDDAAGLAISEKMRSQIRGLDRASANSQDGISLIQTAEGALNETQSILQRMRELAVQAANGTNTDSDRNEIQKEVNQLTSEINRIANTTEFNTMKLLKGNTNKAEIGGVDTETLKQGETGVVQGAIDNFKVDKESKEAVDSSLKLVGNQADATGKLKDTALDESKTGVAGQKATAKAGGIQFSSINKDTTLNGKEISIVTIGEKNTDTPPKEFDEGIIESADSSKIYVVLKQSTVDKLDTAQELISKIQNMQTAATANTATVASGLVAAGVITSTADVKAAKTDLKTLKLEISLPTEIHTADDLKSFLPTAVGSAQMKTDTLGGGEVETLGKYTFELDKTFKEDGDKITVGGETFTTKTDDPKAIANEVGLGSSSSSITFRIDDFSKAGAAATNTLAIANGTGTVAAFDISANGNGVVTTKTIVDALKRNTDFTDEYEVYSNGDYITIATKKDGNSASDYAKSFEVTLAGGLQMNLDDGNGAVTSKNATAGVDMDTIDGSAATDAQKELARKVAQSQNLALAMNANANLNQHYIVRMEGAVDGGGTDALTQAQIDAMTDFKITIQERVDQGGISKASGTELNTTLSVAGSGGEDDTITITNPNGKNGIEFEINSTGTIKGNDIDGNTSTAVLTGDVVITQDDTNANKFIINLADNANGNKASKIQQALREFTQSKEAKLKDGTKINFKDFEVTSAGNWDSTTKSGVNINHEWSSTSGGVEEQKGTYSFDLTEAFAEGDEILIAGKKFIAKAKNADVYKGELDVSSKDKAVQAKKLKELLGADTDIAAKYDIKLVDGTTKLTLVEKIASGEDMKEEDVSVQATGTQGQYKVDEMELQKDGASITIDGQKIDFSSKNAHVGYENGTAIKVTDTVEDQKTALAAAINKNAELSKKYEASIGDDGSLMLTQKIGSDVAPEITTTSSTKGTFDVTFQVGANTGQSMTIAIGDNRANALGVAGDGTEESIMAENGATAYYTKVSNVTDGTSNDNIEFALDVTSFEKATAAIGVIDDALSAISAQRSQLGAYQNRLEHTIANLDNTSENLQASESRIRDVDMAKEMTNFSKNNILQQAAQSMLAQANQSTQGVLTLLR